MERRFRFWGLVAGLAVLSVVALAWVRWEWV